MNVVNPENTTHQLKVIPRLYAVEDLVFELYNEQTKVTSTPTFTSSLVDGYLTIIYDYDFIDKQKFQIKIYKNALVIYRGKLQVTKQDTQTYKADNEIYYYE